MSNSPAVARGCEATDKQVHGCTLTTRPKDAEVRKGTAQTAEHLTGELNKETEARWHAHKPHTKEEEGEWFI